MKIEEAKAIADGYNVLQYCDGILLALDPPKMIGEKSDYTHFDINLGEDGDAREVADAINKLGHGPKGIRDRLELLTQELRALLIQGIIEIKEAAAEQLAKR